MTVFDFAADITARARWARTRNNNHPEPAWSTGERLAVALVLGDQATLDCEGYTRQQRCNGCPQTSRSTATPPTPTHGSRASGPRSDRTGPAEARPGRPGMSLHQSCVAGVCGHRCPRRERVPAHERRQQRWWGLQKRFRRLQAVAAGHAGLLSTSPDGTAAAHLIPEVARMCFWKVGRHVHWRCPWSRKRPVGRSRAGATPSRVYCHRITEPISMPGLSQRRRSSY